MPRPRSNANLPDPKTMFLVIGLGCYAIGVVDLALIWASLPDLPLGGPHNVVLWVMVGSISVFVGRYLGDIYQRIEPSDTPETNEDEER